MKLRPDLSAPLVAGTVVLALVAVVLFESSAHTLDSYHQLAAAGSGPPAPDLTAGDTTITGTLARFAPATFTANVSNIGDDAANNFPNMFQVANVDLSATVAYLDAGTKILGPDGVTQINASMTFNTAGVFNVRACANETSSWTGISESNPDNNCGEWHTFTISYPGLSASCTASRETMYEGESMSWTASASGSNDNYTYTWTGTDGLSGTGTTIQKTYTVAGQKTARVQIDVGPNTVYVDCLTPNNAPSVTVLSCAPTLTADPSTIDAGQTIDLTWSVPQACATSCIFSDGHTVNTTQGTYTVTPPTPINGTTDTYAITCPINNGKSGQAAITVRVPLVSIKGTPNRVQYNATTTVTWDASNVTSCSITKNSVVWKAILPADDLYRVVGTSTDVATAQNIYRISCTAAGGVMQTSATSIVNLIPSSTEI